MPGSRDAAPLVHARTQVIYGNRNWVPSFIAGTTQAYLDVQAWTIAEGEPFTDRDVLNGNRVCLLDRPWSESCFRVKPLSERIFASRMYRSGLWGCLVARAQT